jgi:hypothetical protein
MSSSSELNDGFDLTPILFLPMFAALWYGVLNRTLDDFLLYGLSIAGVLEINFVGIILLNWYERKEKPSSGDIFGAFVIFPVAACLGGAIFYSIGVVLIDTYLYLWSPKSGNSMTVALTVVLTLGIGIALFFFRLRRRALYGLTEVVVGVVVSVYRVTSAPVSSSLTSPDLYLVVLTAGIYLIVRGLDNLHQGLSEKPTDQMTTMLLGSTAKSSNTALSNTVPSDPKAIPSSKQT